MRHLFWPGVALVAATAAVLVVRALLLAWLRRLGPRFAGLSVFAGAVRPPSLLWCLVFGFWVAIEVASEMNQLPRRLSQQLALGLEAAIVISVTFTASAIVQTTHDEKPQPAAPALGS